MERLNDSELVALSNLVNAQAISAQLRKVDDFITDEAVVLERQVILRLKERGLVDEYGIAEGSGADHAENDANFISRTPEAEDLRKHVTGECEESDDQVFPKKPSLTIVNKNFVGKFPRRQDIPTEP